jgi:outer membrane protein assembly factor BamD (BamD/ComL family)
LAEEALTISVESYEKLGMKDLADASRRVLQTNFPNNAMVSTGPRATKPWWKLW